MNRYVHTTDNSQVISDGILTQIETKEVVRNHYRELHRVLTIELQPLEKANYQSELADITLYLALQKEAPQSLLDLAFSRKVALLEEGNSFSLAQLLYRPHSTPHYSADKMNPDSFPSIRRSRGHLFLELPHSNEEHTNWKIETTTSIPIHRGAFPLLLLSTDNLSFSHGTLCLKPTKLRLVPSPFPLNDTEHSDYFHSLHRFYSQTIGQPHFPGALDLSERAFIRYEWLEKPNQDYLAAMKRALRIFDSFLWSTTEDLTLKDFKELQTIVHGQALYKNGTDLNNRSLRDRRVDLMISTNPTAAEYVKQLFTLFKDTFSLGDMPDGYVPFSSLSQGRAQSYSEGGYVAPSNHVVDIYLQTAVDSLNRIRILLRTSSDTRAVQTLVQKLLKDYYYPLVSARPFMTVNNSLFMAQTNYLLRCCGGNEIAHQDWDHFFRRITSEQAAFFWPLILNKTLPPMHTKNGPI